MSSANITPLPRSLAGGAKLRSRARQRGFESLIMAALICAAAFSILVTFTIIFVLFGEAIQFFRMPGVSLQEFLFTTQWNPLLGNQKHFGVWPLVCGTALVTGVAMFVAVPLGLITAVYLSEYAPRKVRSIIKPTLEMLAGVPTVVYGFFALTVITPALKMFHDGFNVYNVFSAGIAVGILCLPTISSLAEDALQAVPRSLREGSLGLGGTRFDTTVKVVLPAALSGIVSAILLASARAIGETMIVALAAGSLAQLTLDVRQPVQTITAFMVQMALGDVSNFSVEYYSMYAVAAVLFLMTFSLTIIGQIVRQRFREVYQ
jgi:phosphate transport system permease protein